MAPEALSVPLFASTQLALLADELAAEVQSSAALIADHTPTALQRGGLALTNLTVGSRRTGLGGRTVLELEPDPAVNSSPELPEHGLRPGDIVLVADQPAGSAKKREVKELERKGARAVVTRVRRESVGVALDDGRGAGEEKDEVDFGPRVWIVKLADEVTYKR
jgi:DNA polymerase alpha-associated DNA helicase A